MNTNSNAPAEKSPEIPRAAGPGSQLRQARLDLKLAPEDVAHILHLSARQIVALESDDYENLPGPTYIRGYLRGYAQLLGLSAEPALEAYNRLIASKKPVDLGRLSPKPEIRSDHQLIKFATVGVVAIVLGLSAVWWREQERPAVPVPTHELSSQSKITDEPASGDELSAPVAATDESQSPVVAGVKPPFAVAPAPTANAPVASNPIVPVAPQTEASGPRARLVIRTQLDSWVDVRDAQGNRLLYETVSAGRTVALEGVTPFSVFLGNVDGVSVEFNGQPYDTSRHKRGEIARFTLGEAARTP